MKKNKQNVTKKVIVAFTKDDEPQLYYIDCDTINKGRELKKQLQKMDGYDNVKVIERTIITKIVN